jgi:hypothetical protein
MKDLCSLMHAAVNAKNDLEMIEVLQVGKQEMPEAVKTLQRALEKVGDGTNTGDILGGIVFMETGEGEIQSDGKQQSATILTMESRSSSGSGGSMTQKDTLDREFIESSIDALRKYSLHSGTIETLPRRFFPHQRPSRYSYAKWRFGKHLTGASQEVIFNSPLYFGTGSLKPSIMPTASPSLPFSLNTINKFFVMSGKTPFFGAALEYNTIGAVVQSLSEGVGLCMEGLVYVAEVPVQAGLRYRGHFGFRRRKGQERVAEGWEGGGRRRRRLDMTGRGRGAVEGKAAKAAQLLQAGGECVGLAVKISGEWV